MEPMGTIMVFLPFSKASLISCQVISSSLTLFVFGSPRVLFIGCFGLGGRLGI
jgi:hypothetical protein